MDSRANSQHPLNLDIFLGTEGLHKLFPLLQRGFVVRNAAGCSVRQLLVDRLCLPPEYVDSRVQTVFLDGKAVDDFDGPMVSGGATVALSAALPGLAGATFRKGGYFAGFRSGVTHDCDEETPKCMHGSLTLKLFNLILHDLGPAFLQKGVIIPGAHFREWLAGQTSQFWTTCKTMTINGNPVTPDDLGRMEWSDEPILLRAVTDTQV